MYHTTLHIIYYTAFVCTLSLLNAFGKLWLWQIRNWLLSKHPFLRLLENKMKFKPFSSQTKHRRRKNTAAQPRWFAIIAAFGWNANSNCITATVSFLCHGVELLMCRYFQIKFKLSVTDLWEHWASIFLQLFISLRLMLLKNLKFYVHLLHFYPIWFFFFSPSSSLPLCKNKSAWLSITAVSLWIIPPTK